MNKPQLDDLQAVRTITETLDPFPAEDRERIIRWVREKLGMSSYPTTAHSSSPPQHHVPLQSALGAHPAPSAKGVRDVKSFLAEKDPKSDRQR